MLKGYFNKFIINYVNRFDPLSKQRAVVSTHRESMRIPIQGEKSPARFTRRFTCHGNSFGELMDVCSFASPQAVVFVDPHTITSLIYKYTNTFSHCCSTKLE